MNLLIVFSFGQLFWTNRNDVMKVNGVFFTGVSFFVDEWKVKIFCLVKNKSINYHFNEISFAFGHEFSTLFQNLHFDESRLSENYAKIRNKS